MSEKILRGDRVKQARKAKGLTQDDLAGELGMVRSNISHIENGKVSLDSNKLFKLANMLEVDPEWLMEPAPQPTPGNVNTNRNNLTVGGTSEGGNVEVRVLREQVEDLKRQVEEWKGMYHKVLEKLLSK